MKAAIGKAFKLNPKTISAGVIRDVRKRLGIDRPGAIAYAKALLKKNPVLEAKKVIESVGGKFGIRLGPPDVSRLRPAGSKRQRAVRTVRAAGRTSRIRQARPPGPSSEGLAFRRRDLRDVSGQRKARGSRGVLPRSRGAIAARPAV